MNGHGDENQTQTLSSPLRPATQQTRHDAAVVLLLRRRPRPPLPLPLFLLRRRPCPPTRALPPLPPPPLPRASARHGFAVPLRGSRFHRPATGDGDAGAPVRRQGQVPRPDHAHHLQSQEIQDEGPLVHEVPLQNVEGRPDPQVARRQAPQCTPQVQVSKAETSEACFSAFSLRKSYKEAQLLRLGNGGMQDGDWHINLVDEY